MARTAGQQARRAIATGAGAAATLAARPGGLGHVGDAGQSGPGAAHIARPRKKRPAGARPHAQDAGGGHAAAAARRALSVGRPSGHGDAAAGGARNRTQRQHAGLHQHPRSQAELWYQALLEAQARMGRIDRAAPRLAGPQRARLGREQGSRSGALRAVVCTSAAWIWAWIFCRWSACCRSARPKASRACCSVPGAPATRRGGHRGSRWCPRTAWSWWKALPRAPPCRPGRSKRANRRCSRWTCWCSTWSPWRWAAALCPTLCSPRCAAPRPMPVWRQRQWQWCLDFVSQGGASLSAYPDYRRVQPDEAGVWRVPDARLARRHRMPTSAPSSATPAWSCSTAVAPSSAPLKKALPARLKPGDCFLFGGRLLELIRVHEMTAWVKRASGRRPAVPRWNGGRMPLSTTLADAVVEQLALAAQSGRLRAPRWRPRSRCWPCNKNGRPAHAADAAGRDLHVARRQPFVPLPVRRPPCAPGLGQPVRLARGAAHAAHVLNGVQRLWL